MEAALKERFDRVEQLADQLNLPKSRRKLVGKARKNVVSRGVAHVTIEAIPSLILLEIAVHWRLRLEYLTLHVITSRMWMERQRLQQQVDSAPRRSRIGALLGPRQCGKRVLARHFATGRKTEYFDLEDPTDARRLENPSLALEPLEGLVVIDEIQRKPKLFPLLRVLADRQPLPARFLILGSASPDIIRQSSETLAGRIEFLYMSGFSIEENGPEHLTPLWHRSGFPLFYLAQTDEESAAWRGKFIHTFLERDLRNFGIESPPPPNSAGSGPCWPTRPRRTERTSDEPVRDPLQVVLLRVCCLCGIRHVSLKGAR